MRNGDNYSFEMEDEDTNDHYLYPECYVSRCRDNWLTNKRGDDLFDKQRSSFGGTTTVHDDEWRQDERLYRGPPTNSTVGFRHPPHSARAHYSAPRTPEAIVSSHYSAKRGCFTGLDTTVPHRSDVTASGGSYDLCHCTNHQPVWRRGGNCPLPPPINQQPSGNAVTAALPTLFNNDDVMWLSNPTPRLVPISQIYHPTPQKRQQLNQDEPSALVVTTTSSSNTDSPDEASNKIAPQIVRQPSLKDFGIGASKIGVVVHGMTRIGPYHSGLLVNNRVEYHFFRDTGISSHDRSSRRRPMLDLPVCAEISIGTAPYSPKSIDFYCQHIASLDFNSQTYDLLENNCNHFVHDAIERLRVDGKMPAWINRPARVTNAILNWLPNRGRKALQNKLTDHTAVNQNGNDGRNGYI